ncbi:MAG: nucleoside recognition domain-containing protein [Pseudomonadota bacterium]
MLAITAPTASTPDPAPPLRFLLPAALGAVIFLGPVVTGDRQTVVFGLITDAIHALLGSAINEVLLLVIGVAAIGALLVALIAPKGPEDALVTQMFRTSWPWILLRLFGFAVVLCVYLDAGPALLRQPDTGITVVRDIGQNVVVIYFAGLLLMPLLTEYGLMEFAGTLCRPLFSRLFRLPGRAAIDTLTSIAAAAAIGLLVTISQYRRGYYSVREACIIACNFSLVAIPFTLLIAKVARIESLFFGWYAAVLTACVLCAMILARIPPLARLPDTHAATPPTVSTDSEAQGLAAAWRAARLRAASAPGPRAYLTGALRNFAITASGVMGPSLAVATLAALLLFHSPFMTTLTLPLSLVLEALGTTDAQAIANGMTIGFADQFLPALVAAQLDSPFWRFVLAGLAVTQVIFLSEFALLMLRSPLPLGLGTLFVLFLLRTVITLPVLLLFAGWLTP